MIDLNPDKNGKLSAEATAHLLGSYSFSERIRRRGVGSAKVMYNSGVQLFDALERGLASETGFVSFELLKTGLVMRFNNNQRLCSVGIRSAEIERITLVGHRMEDKRNMTFGRKNNSGRHGKLEIILLSGNLSFTVREIDYNHILHYFSRDDFSEKFRFSEADDFPAR